MCFRQNYKLDWTCVSQQQNLLVGICVFGKIISEIELVLDNFIDSSTPILFSYIIYFF